MMNRGKLRVKWIGASYRQDQSLMITASERCLKNSRIEWRHWSMISEVRVPISEYDS